MYASLTRFFVLNCLQHHSLAFQQSGASSSTPAAPSSGPSDDVDAPDFVHRVSQLPIVTSALRVYSQGKASSRVVKVPSPFVLALTYLPTDHAL